MKYDGFRFYGNNKSTDSAGFSFKTFVSVDLEEEKPSNMEGTTEERKKTEPTELWDNLNTKDISKRYLKQFSDNL